jgi:RNA polymerase sigma-70 factor, ECF subfamily
MNSWELVERAKTGDREAFASLYRIHAGQLAGWILMKVRDRYLAEDFTSETFLRALRRIDSVTDQGRDFEAR